MANFMRLADGNVDQHGERVAELVSGALNKLRRVQQPANLIVWAARVHDIGKTAVPASILNKTGDLTAEEWRQVREHAAVGADMLSKYGHPYQIVEMVRHHHERWDGKGYPNRLRGNDIPFGSRIIAVAEAYDAMTRPQPYRLARTPMEAAEILRQGAGTQWDPSMVEVFLDSIALRLQMAARVPVLAGAGQGTYSSW